MSYNKLRIVIFVRMSGKVVLQGVSLRRETGNRMRLSNFVNTEELFLNLWSYQNITLFLPMGQFRDS